jgi:flagellar assembly protein FliH
MGLIKAQTVPTSVAPFSMQDIETAAKMILLRARRQAEQILAEAQTEAAALKKQAHAEALTAGQKEGHAKGLALGHQKGREEALSEQREQLAGLAGALAESAAALDASRVALEADAKKAVVRLAIAIAERITKRQGALDPAVALANVEDALGLVVQSTNVRIAVHPSHKATLADVLPRIQMKWPNLKHVEIIADGTLLPGGCRVYTGGGQIDGDLRLQLERIAAELLPAPEDGE